MSRNNRWNNVWRCRYVNPVMLPVDEFYIYFLHEDVYFVQSCMQLTKKAVDDNEAHFFFFFFFSR